MNTPNPFRQQEAYPTPPGTGPSSRQFPGGLVGQPGRYTAYHAVASLRRRTQVELQMFHGIVWLGYGEVIPNVSVVTGGPLAAGPLSTHGTWGTRKGGGEHGDNVVCSLADKVSRSLAAATNRRAAEQHERDVRPDCVSGLSEEGG